MTHPDVGAEQAHLDAAYRHGERMRQRAAEFAASDDLSASEVDTLILQAHFAHRAAALGNALKGVVCFGRIDEPGERHYIGRTHIEDDGGTALVVDWRAPVAVPFYRATVANPMDLARRRRFVVEGRSLVDILEEDFDDPDSLNVAGGVPDPLLAELGRARTGRMRDIVATIAAEQDEVIRAGIEECLVVQGGPGTGKTAVGLHRAAFLLYEHRERLTREGVLVLGPNRLFLDYISQVLPTLGERSARQATIESLLGQFRVVAEDTAEAAAVKGDQRMAQVIRNAARASISAAPGDLDIPYRTRIVHVEAKEVDELAAVAADADVPWSVRRHGFRAGLFRLVHERLPESLRSEIDPTSLGAAIMAGPSRKVIDNVWKTVTGTTIVRKLLTSRTALAAAAAGVLTPDEQAAVLRKPAKKGRPDPWTRFDLALLDEAEAFVNGTSMRYGHIVVDEAQDRSPMELRMIGRRSTNGSMTILGDLAQATTPAAADDWHEAARHLGLPIEPRLVELTVGYRLPGAVLDFANRLLPAAAPGVTPAQSVREEGDPPSVSAHASMDELLNRVVALAEGFAKRYTTSAVVCPHSLTQAVTKRLVDHGISFATDLSASLEGDVAVLSPVAAKGLEFDAVAVVEPAAVVAEEPGGERALFVALTRAVQHLSVLHVEPLPEALTTPSR